MGRFVMAAKQASAWDKFKGLGEWEFHSKFVNHTIVIRPRWVDRRNGTSDNGHHILFRPSSGGNGQFTTEDPEEAKFLIEGPDFRRTVFLIGDQLEGPQPSVDAQIDAILEATALGDADRLQEIAQGERETHSRQVVLRAADRARVRILAAAEAADDYSEWDWDDLRRAAKDRGIPIHGSKREDIEDALEQSDRAAAFSA